MAGLASKYSNQGQWKEARELEVRVMEIRWRVFGADRDTLGAMARLAYTNRDLGQCNIGVGFMTRSATVSLRILGCDTIILTLEVLL